MWKAFPNEPRIKRFVRGHLYYLMPTSPSSSIICRVVEFKGTNYSGGKTFLRVAFSIIRGGGSLPSSLGRAFESFPKEAEFHIEDHNLKNLMIKEIKVEDLPLYVSWYTYPRFVELLRGEPRKTRVLSKSSKVISKQ